MGLQVFLRFLLEISQLFIFSHKHQRQMTNIILIRIINDELTLIYLTNLHIQKSFIIQQSILLDLLSLVFNNHTTISHRLVD